MPGRPDPTKLREWNDRFRRFGKSRQTVADFCRAEGVPQPSFYYWKRRLAGGSRQHPSVKRPRQQSIPRVNVPIGFRSVVVTPAVDAASVKVRLPGGAVIEMRDDLAVIEQVVKQLLEQQAGRGEMGC